MAIFDWNRDGKIDLQDEFLEYNAFVSCTQTDDEDEEYDDIFDDEDDE